MVSEENFNPTPLSIDQNELDALIAHSHSDGGSVPQQDLTIKNTDDFHHRKSGTQSPQTELDVLIGKLTSNNDEIFADTPEEVEATKEETLVPKEPDRSTILPPSISQDELDTLLGNIPQSTPQPNTQKVPMGNETDIDQTELDALLAQMDDTEIFADTPDQALIAKTHQVGQPADTEIDQAELDALLAHLGEDELISDTPPQKKTNKPDKPTPPKVEKTLSQEEIDALLASMG